MGQITKSFVINVPSSVVYQALKEVDSSRYTSDLTKQGKVTDRLVAEVPNTLIRTEYADAFLKINQEVSFRKLQEDLCEVTLKYEYSFADEDKLKTLIAQNIEGLLMLEYGYNRAKTKKA